jgi:hypothetical protein
MKFSLSLSLAALAAIVIPMANGQACDPTVQETKTVDFTSSGQENNNNNN